VDAELVPVVDAELVPESEVLGLHGEPGSEEALEEGGKGL